MQLWGIELTSKGNCWILIWVYKIMFTVMMHLHMHVLDMYTCTCTCNAQLFVPHTHSHMHMHVLEKHVGLHAMYVDVRNDDVLQHV